MSSPQDATNRFVVLPLGVIIKEQLIADAVTKISVQSGPEVRVSGLRKTYERTTGREVVRTHALVDVHLTIEREEFVSVIGPSGCGKTTVLKVIAGLLEPTGGTVEVAGQAVKGPGTDRGVVFQQPSLMPWKSVRDNVLLALEFAKIPRAERSRRADKYLELVELKGFEGHFPGELSGGMQQRVGLARALALEPRVLLMDEPFGALDAITRQQMQIELIRIWNQEKKAVLFVTHSIEEALLMSDRIVVMANGGVAHVVEVPLSRPRTSEALLNDPVARQLRTHLESLL
jgi:NitT/TauT family transport system ATP-binding protein